MNINGINIYDSNNKQTEVINIINNNIREFKQNTPSVIDNHDKPTNPLLLEYITNQLSKEKLENINDNFELEMYQFMVENNITDYYFPEVGFNELIMYHDTSVKEDNENITTLHLESLKSPENTLSFIIPININELKPISKYIISVEHINYYLDLSPFLPNECNYQSLVSVIYDFLIKAKTVITENVDINYNDFVGSIELKSLHKQNLSDYYSFGLPEDIMQLLIGFLLIEYSDFFKYETYNVNRNDKKLIIKSINGLFQYGLNLFKNHLGINTTIKNIISNTHLSFDKTFNPTHLDKLNNKDLMDFSNNTSKKYLIYTIKYITISIRELIFDLSLLEPLSDVKLFYKQVNFVYNYLSFVLVGYAPEYGDKIDRIMIK